MRPIAPLASTAQAAARELHAVATFPLLAPLKRANVLLLGPAGAGKSSLVSTLDGLVRGAITRRADYGGASTSLTMALRSYTFSSTSIRAVAASGSEGASAQGGKEAKGGLPLVLWDTKGWCPASYQSGVCNGWF
jgi:predicted GTPase